MRPAEAGRVARVVALALATWAAITAPARAHDFSILDVVVVVKSDGTWWCDLTVDVDALALGVSPGIDSAELAARLEALSAAELEAAIESARDTLSRRVRVRFDGEAQHPAIDFPEIETPLAAPDAPPTVLGTTARLSGRVPGDARELTFFASRAFGPVHLTVLEQATTSGARWVLVPGEQSPPFRLGASRDDVAGVTLEPGGGSVVARYARLGFEHILPRGLDHILFVLGLFLLGTRLAPLLWQVTAFTVAHTLTLGLSMYGLIQLPSRIVETLIALSIAYVAVENLLTSELKPWRPALVFAFGLLHGLGFAGVLRELGLPEGEFLTALAAFNVGVELGQLAVVGLAFLAVGWLRDRPWYRSGVVLPASALIGLVGLYWAIERGLGLA